MRSIWNRLLILIQILLSYVILVNLKLILPAGNFVITMEISLIFQLEPKLNKQVYWAFGVVREMVLV